MRGWGWGSANAGGVSPAAGDRFSLDLVKDKHEGRQHHVALATEPAAPDDREKPCRLFARAGEGD